MAGTVTVTESRTGSVKKLRFAWTSSAGGLADLATTFHYNGKIIALMTDPGATAPDDNYDVALLDADGDDVLAGAGLNRDTANTEIVAEALLGAVATSILTLQVSGAGAAKEGVVVVWLR